MTRLDTDQANSWIMDFHKLRIAGFFSDAEKDKIWKRIVKRIEKQGLKISTVGFYQYEFHEIGGEF